jgi:hypothetical protein
MFYAFAFHWGDWRWNDGVALAVCGCSLIEAFLFQERLSPDLVIMLLVSLGMLAMDQPIRVLQIAGIVLVVGTVVLHVKWAALRQTNSAHDSHEPSSLCSPYSPFSKFAIVVPSPPATTCKVITPASRFPPLCV